MRGAALAPLLACLLAVSGETTVELNGSNGYVAINDLVRRYCFRTRDFFRSPLRASASQLAPRRAGLAVCAAGP
jgi:hypothetical protein